MRCTVVGLYGATLNLKANVAIRDASLRAYRDALEMAKLMNASVSRYVDGDDSCDIPWPRVELALQAMELMLEEDLPQYFRDRLILSQLQQNFAQI